MRKLHKSIPKFIKRQLICQVLGGDGIRYRHISAPPFILAQTEQGQNLV